MERPDIKRGLRIALAIGVIAAGIRVLLIFHERDQAAQKPQEQNVALEADAYVVPKKLHAYDVNSARAGLVGKPVWVRSGYGVAFYAFNPRIKRSDFSREAGLLAPIEQLQVSDVVTSRTPGSGAGELAGPPGAQFRVHSDEQQVMAVFAKDGKSYAFPIGTSNNGDFHFFLDDLLYVEDPHQLYKHWPAPVWQAIEQHRVLAGMNQLQVSFAIGVPDSSTNPTDQSNTTLHYASNGHPVNVTYENGKVTEVTAEQAAATGGK